jgi:hypothetical protein
MKCNMLIGLLTMYNVCLVGELEIRYGPIVSCCCHIASQVPGLHISVFTRGF